MDSKIVPHKNTRIIKTTTLFAVKFKKNQSQEKHYLMLQIESNYREKTTQLYNSTQFTLGSCSGIHPE
ncbi:hypothetical protein KORDIASMS9_04467 [Kordia sp. SMS9]|nr:hypothetical protein KORDIASMS9_04467 [Kordia sp. SMS9]